ncbi:MAG: SEC-C metal-binding domain-containing protein [Thermodesulfobacteriota bacterium]
MNDNGPVEREDYSSICVKQCGGACCDPWWGIIDYSYTVQKGLGGEKALQAELVKGIRIREKRIVQAYVTAEPRPRPLFTRPERYNLVIRDIVEEGGALRLDLIIMFAFRCRFLSEDNTCLIHPTIIDGADIRPPHCAQLGSPGQRSGEQGYCRIIGAAEQTQSTDSPAVADAIEVEKNTAIRYLADGVADMEEAASRAVKKVALYCRGRDTGGCAAAFLEEKKPGRNEPCHCGSGKKYKKCHGA